MSAKPTSANRIGSTAAFLFASAAIAGAQAPVSPAFTYQGRLDEAGGPASGVYDFNFALMDAAAGGNQVGSMLFFDNLPVTDGLFTATLDFGPDAMNGEARWLQVYVRPGSHIVPPTPLMPRQPLTAAPYAQFALQSAQWRTENGNLTNNNDGFVGINRSTAVGPAEFFGVQAPVQSGYGGMYIRTDGAGAKPFYGYSNGVKSIWTYMDGATGDWRLHNGGDRLTVTDDGYVGVGTNTPNARLHVSGGGLPDALYATNSTGRAGHFFLPSGSSGNALYAVTYGSGRAASFENHALNDTPTVSVFKNGGTAIKATGDVEVDGQVMAKMGTGLGRGTPIAFGKYKILAGGVTLLTSSSGNVLVTGSGTVSTVTIQGETDPADWLVVANLVYEEPGNPVPHYRLVAGSPDSGGSIDFHLRCVENCGSAPNTDKYIHFAIYKPY